MEYFLAGYYVICKNPVEFGSFRSKMVHTCSQCINDSLLDHWSYTWTTDNNGHIEEIKEKYRIDDDRVDAIREWVDKALDDKKIGWINLFKDLNTATEYKATFFPHLPDARIYSIYFAAPEAEALLHAFPPPEDNSAYLGIYENLVNKIPEADSVTESLIGFDIIGVEMDGSFHTFHCHDIAATLIDKFALTLNEFGLFNEIADWLPLTEHMNDQESGYEPVPWFVCKVKYF